MRVYWNNLTHIDPWAANLCHHQGRRQECPSLCVTHTWYTRTCALMGQQRSMRSKHKTRGTSLIPDGTSVKSVCSYIYQRVSQSVGVTLLHFTSSHSHLQSISTTISQTFLVFCLWRCCLPSFISSKATMSILDWETFASLVALVNQWIGAQ